MWTQTYGLHKNQLLARENRPKAPKGKGRFPAIDLTRGNGCFTECMANPLIAGEQQKD